MQMDESSRLQCPLIPSEKVAISKEVVRLLRSHYFLDVFEDDKYLFTLERHDSRNTFEYRVSFKEEHNHSSP